jgi:hypothetical protein
MMDNSVENAGCYGFEGVSMLKYLVTITLLLVLISACTPGTAADTAEPTASSFEPTARVSDQSSKTSETQTLPLARAKEIQEIEMKPVKADGPDQAEESLPESAKPLAGESQEEILVAPSGSVDLAKLPAIPVDRIGPSELIVQPAPGNPDPKSKLEKQTKQDLAQRLEVDFDDIRIVSLEFVEWSDGSLGCPDRGMMYIQVITPGYIAILESNGEQFEYHTDTNRNIILCQDGRPSK